MEHKTDEDKDFTINMEISTKADSSWHKIKSTCPICKTELLVSFCLRVEDLQVGYYYKNPETTAG